MKDGWINLRKEWMDEADGCNNCMYVWTDK